VPIFISLLQTCRDDYFINSADKVGYFYEEDAIDDKGI
jgi:hypothetical protein